MKFIKISSAMSCIKWLSVILCVIISSEILSIAPQDYTFQRASRNASISNFHRAEYFTVPMTISQAGVYGLIENSLFEPIADGEAALVIDADDVLLDLNLKSITQAPGNDKVNVDAIKVTPNRKNIIIRNGAINDIMGNAIHICDGVEIIDMYDLTITNPGQIGIFFDGLSTGTGIRNIAIANSIIQGVETDLVTSVTGIYLTNTAIMNMDNITVNSARSTTADACGICAVSCNSLRIISSVVGDNVSGGCSGIGFYFENCQNLFFSDVLAGRNVCNCALPTSIALGFKLKNSSNLFFQKCTSSSNAARFACHGFSLEDCSFILFDGCESFNNTSSLGSAAGFFAKDTLSVSFDKCIAGSNTGAVNGHGYFLEDCTISGVTNSVARVDFGVTGTAYGIRLKNSVGISLIGNKLLGHQGGAGGFGIFDSFGSFTPNTILSNIAINNTVNFSPGAPTIPIYTGGLSGTPGPFENVSL